MMPMRARHTKETQPSDKATAERDERNCKEGLMTKAFIEVSATDVLFIKMQPKSSLMNFIFTPSRATVRQCQSTAEINITNKLKRDSSKGLSSLMDGWGGRKKNQFG